MAVREEGAIEGGKGPERNQEWVRISARVGRCSAAGAEDVRGYVARHKKATNQGVW